MSDWLIISVKLVISSNMKYGQHLPLNYMSFQFSTSSRVITRDLEVFSQTKLLEDHRHQVYMGMLQTSEP